MSCQLPAELVIVDPAGSVAGSASKLLTMTASRLPVCMMQAWRSAELQAVGATAPLIS